MKKLKKFATVAEYNEFIDSIGPFDYPVTSYIVETQETKFDDGLEKKPLTMIMLSAGTITWSNVSGMEYKKNKGSWTSWPGSLSVNTNDKISFRRTTSTSYDYSSRIQCSAPFNVEGNVLSIIDKTNYTSLNSVTTPLNNLFYSTAVVNAENLILPTKQAVINASIYNSMFNDCKRLVYPPKKLKATTKDYYNPFSNMFYNCTSMIKSPKFYYPINNQFNISDIFRGCPIARIDFGNVVPNVGLSGGGNLIFDYYYNKLPKLRYLICDSCDGSIASTEFSDTNVKTNFDITEVKMGKDPFVARFGVEDYNYEYNWDYYVDEGLTINHEYYYVDEITYNGQTCYLWSADDDSFDSSVWTQPYSPKAYAITETDPEETVSLAMYNVNQLDNYANTHTQPQFSFPIVAFLTIDGEEYESTWCEDVIVEAQQA